MLDCVLVVSWLISVLFPDLVKQQKSNSLHFNSVKKVDCAISYIEILMVIFSVFLLNQLTFWCMNLIFFFKAHSDHLKHFHRNTNFFRCIWKVKLQILLPSSTFCLLFSPKFAINSESITENDNTFLMASPSVCIKGFSHEHFHNWISYYSNLPKLITMPISWKTFSRCHHLKVIYQWISCWMRESLLSYCSVVLV